MAVVSNVLGYINNKKWGVYTTYSYAEIIAMSADNALAVLNSDASGYYTILSNGGHIYNGAVANSAGNGKQNFGGYSLEYSNGTWSKVVIPYKTFTIQWTENENPATVVSSVQYLDDAAGLTRGVSKEFDEFFGYYACRLSADGQESEIVEQSYSGNTVNLPLGTLATATSGNDVMICFPKRGIKMSKSGSVVTLSITNEPDKTGYQYFAFNKGELNSTFDGYTYDAPVDKFYVGAFEMGGSAGATSLPTGTPGSGTFAAHHDNAKAKSSNAGTKVSGYNVYQGNWSAMRWWQREYINALYMMKYGNPNSQAEVGQGRTSGSSVLARGNSWSSNSSLATWGDTSGTTSAMRLFGIENWWGNVTEWCMGIKTTGSYNCRVNLWNDDGDTTVATIASYQDTGYGSAIGTNGRPSLTIAGDNKGMFIGTSVYGSQDWSKGYCDWSRVNSGSVAAVSGSYSSGSYAGAFVLTVYHSPSNSAALYGSRLLFL